MYVSLKITNISFQGETLSPSLLDLDNLLRAFIVAMEAGPVIQLPPSTTNVFDVMNAKAPLARKTVHGISNILTTVQCLFRKFLYKVWSNMFSYYQRLSYRF